MDTRIPHALIRFGLGRRGEEPLPADPAAWLAQQLAQPDPVLALPGPSTAEGLTAMREDRKDRDAQLQPTRVRDLFKRDSDAAIDSLLTTAAPFRERLVWFWANHFTISMRRGECSAVAGAYIQEAIRPHVTGRFTDMLAAVMHHPAMLMYLDNQGSVGPASPAGQRSHRGLNENLARESLELHTVTPASGYTQADVTEYAKILTGWSIEQNYNPPGFLFRLNTHEPGAKTVMGRTFPHGLEGGNDILAWLGDHPATHRHLATKLVTHFVADQPPPTCVARMETVLRDSHGDLKAAALELIRMPEAWQPLAKLRTPSDYVVAVMRAVDLPADKRGDVRGILSGLGVGFMNAPLPNGYADVAAEWSGPEAVLRRVDWAYSLAGRAGPVDPQALAEASLGPLLTPATQEAVHRAGSRRDGLTLLLASPEFQRR